MTWRQIVQRSEGHIEKLAEGFRQRVAKWYHELTLKKIPVLIYCSVRTPQEQDELYAQGRTKKGPKVTNAKGTPIPQSFHCYARAIDACPAVRNAAGEYVLTWDDTTTYAIMTKVAEKYAMRALSFERPHFEDAMFKDWRELAQMTNTKPVRKPSPGTAVAEKNRQAMQRKVKLRKP